MSNRNTTIDIAKGVGILLVVLGHNWIVAHEHGEVFRVIFSFHMPLFFFLSGLVLKELDTSRSFVMAKADAILKPYLVVLTCWGIGRIFFASALALPYFAGLIYATGNTIEWVPLWYLPHLFLALLVTHAILRITKDRRYRTSWLFGITAISLLAGVFLMRIDWPFSAQNLHAFNQLLNNKHDGFPGLPWSLDLLGVSTAFVLLGFALKDHLVHLRFRVAYMLLAISAFILLHVFFDETMDLHMRQYGHFAITTTEAMLGIYLTFSFSSLMQRCHVVAKLFAYIGTCTLFILIFHSWIEWKAFSFFGKFVHNNNWNAVLGLFFGVLIPVALQEIVRRQRLLAALLLPYKMPVRNKDAHLN